MKRHHVYCGLMLAACSCLTIGCGKVAKLALKGTVENVGASLVEGSSADDIRAMFEQANQACPRQMDAFTTLESIKLIDDKHAEFRYRVNNEGKSLAKRFDKKVLQQAAVKMMKGNAMAVAIAERDLSIEHIYEDAFGGHVFSYTINKEVLAGDPNPLGDEQNNPFNVQTVSAAPAEQVTPDPVSPQSRTPNPDEEIENPFDERSSDTDGSADGEEEEVEPEPEPDLPKAYKPERSNDNPAGVRSNPFFDA